VELKLLSLESSELCVLHSIIDRNASLNNSPTGIVSFSPQLLHLTIHYFLFAKELVELIVEARNLFQFPLDPATSHDILGGYVCRGREDLTVE
jgi:hypothetical protein